MSKQSAVNLNITPNVDGYSIGGGTTPRTLTVSGSDITIIGGSSTLTVSGTDITLIGMNSGVEITFPTSSASMAATNLTNYFSADQYFTGSLIVSGTFIIVSGSSQIPTSISSSGIVGTLIFSSSYLYVATGSNAWQRVLLSDF